MGEYHVRWKFMIVYAGVQFTTTRVKSISAKLTKFLLTRTYACMPAEFQSECFSVHKENDEWETMVDQGGGNGWLGRWFRLGFCPLQISFVLNCKSWLLNEALCEFSLYCLGKGNLFCIVQGNENVLYFSGRLHIDERCGWPPKKVKDQNKIYSHIGTHLECLTLMVES